MFIDANGVWQINTQYEGKNIPSDCVYSIAEKNGRLLAGTRNYGVAYLTQVASSMFSRRKELRKYEKNYFILIDNPCRHKRLCAGERLFSRHSACNGQKDDEKSEWRMEPEGCRWYG